MSASDLLSMCNNIKAELVPYYELLTNVKIVELTNEITLRDTCLVDDDGCYDCLTNTIYLKLYSVNTKQLLPPSIIIFVLLHEFAHVISNDKISTNEENSHSNNFYDCFNDLLKVCSKLEIYKTNSGINDIRRLDSIALNEGTIIGHSKKYPDNKDITELKHISINFRNKIRTYFYKSINGVPTIDNFIKQKLNLKFVFELEQISINSYKINKIA